jgi:hypothetical protein
MYLHTAEVLSPHITKKIGSANSKSAKGHIYKVRKFADLRFAEPICGPPNFALYMSFRCLSKCKFAWDALREVEVSSTE